MVKKEIKRIAKRIVAMFIFAATVISAIGVVSNTYGAPVEWTGKSDAVNDVKHYVAVDLGTKPRNPPKPEDFHQLFGVDMTFGYPKFNESHDAVIKNWYREQYRIQYENDPLFGPILDGMDEKGRENQLKMYVDTEMKNHEADINATIKAQRQAIFAENKAILDYDGIAEDGTLLKYNSSTGSYEPKEVVDEKTITRLVSHTAGVKNYGKEIPSDALSTTKKLSLRMTRSGNIITGLFAPPGEVVKVELKSTSHATKEVEDLGLIAQVGTFSAGNHMREVPQDRDFVRMPWVHKDLKLNQTVNYIGSPLGGPIYISSNGIGGTVVELEITGAVEMPYYIQGETTDDELAEMLETAPGPYFDITTTRGIRMMGPIMAIEGIDVDSIKSSVDFWDKAMNVSYQFQAGGFDSSNQDTNLMSILFDSFVPAGAAVNLGGAYCMCPVSWGKSMLNTEQYIESGGWGNLHEINHSFKWGGATDEVTEIANNVINAMTYMLYTNIAASRTEAGGLRDWNFCVDPYTTMQKINSERSRNPKLDNLELYVAVMQAFGADRFIRAVQIYHDEGGKAGYIKPTLTFATNSDIWMYATSRATGYDMSYYIKDVLGFPLYSSYVEALAEKSNNTDYITQGVVNLIHGDGIPVFIPSGLLYQSGFVYKTEDPNNPEVIEMGRPFRIPFGIPKELNFNTTDKGGYLSVPKGVTAEITKVEEPVHGSVRPSERDGVYIYTPNKNELEDWFYVTANLTINEGDYAGTTQEVTYKIHLLQETAGFSATVYDWPTANNNGVPRESWISNAIVQGVLEQPPVGQLSFDYPGYRTEAAQTQFNTSFVVVEGKLFIDQTGPVDLYTRGDDLFETYVSADGNFDDQPDAKYDRDLQNYVMWSEDQSPANQTIAEKTRVQIYVLAEGEDQPSVDDGYDAVIHQGDPLYVKAHVMNTGGLGHYRICYVKTTVNEEGETTQTLTEFTADNTMKIDADVDNQTPKKSDYPTEKKYFYKDDTYKETDITSTIEFLNGGMEVLKAWDLTKDEPLKMWKNGNGRAQTPQDLAFIVDGNENTGFHGYTVGGSSEPYASEFIFKLADDDAGKDFNVIRYSGHTGDRSRGKLKDYKIYVADTEAGLYDETNLVKQGTAPQGSSSVVYSDIMLDEPVRGQYVRLVAENTYKSAGEFYIYLSEFQLGKADRIEGLGKTEEMDKVDDLDNWYVNRDTNTRNGVAETVDGVGYKYFTGTGIIMYATKGPEYGTMAVELDGVELEPVELHDTVTRYNQPVFFISGLNNEPHELVFWSKEGEKINVEYFEIKNDELVIPERKQDIIEPLFNEEGAYPSEAEKNDPQITHNVIFYKYGYDNDVTVPVKDGAFISEPNPPKSGVEGVEFLGWYDDATFTNKFDFDAQIFADMEAHALWSTPKTFPVHFDMGGHGEQIEDINVPYGTPAERPTDPTDARWSFENWYTDNKLKTVFDFASNLIKGEITIYANWTEKPEAATFTLTTLVDGENGTISPGKSDITANTVETVTFTPDEGYAIDTVTVNDEEVLVQNNTLSITMDSDKKVVVTYKRMEDSPSVDTYTLNTSVDGGNGTISPSKNGITENTVETVTFKPDEGYVIDTVTVNGVEFVIQGNTLSITMDSDKTVVVTYKAVTLPPETERFTVSFEMNNHGKAIEPQMVNKGSKATEPPKPVDKEYTFVGWFADEGLKERFDFGRDITQDTKIYAMWEKTPQPEGPDTGDSSNIPLLISLMLVSGGALLGSLVYFQKRRRR